MHKNVSTLLAASVVLLFAGAGCSSSNQTAYPVKVTSFAEDHPGVSVSIQSGATVTEEVVKGKPTVKKVTPTLDFNEAMKIYAPSGYRFQFVKCSGNPGTLTMKHGVKFMLDNRDEVGHTFGIGAKSYALKGYDFAIVSVQTSGTYNITCDGGGAARVIVAQ